MAQTRCLVVLAVFLFQLAVAAQSDNADVEKQGQRRLATLADQVLSDAANLKLGENRAFVFARVGNIVWKSDPKRALSLFQTAVDELIDTQQLAEANSKSMADQFELLNQSARPALLNQIANHNAAFALESLYRTRPAVLQRALAATASKSSKISNLANNYAYLVQNETALEQTLMRMAAEQNPERAARILKESLTRGITGETLNLLKKLNEKDPDAAAEIAGNMIGKLIDQGFMIDNRADYQKLNLAQNMLSEFVREKGADEKYLHFDADRARTLAEKTIAFYLDQGTRYGYSPAAILPIAEKLSPGSVPRLKQAERTNPYRGFGYEYDPDAMKLLNSNPTAEELIAAAKRFPEASRPQLYQSAATKYAQEGNMNAALAVIKDNFADDVMEDAIRNLNFQYANNLIGAGKYSEAESAIEELPESSRFSAYVSLANSIYAADPEKNKVYALAVLSRARGGLPDQPETANELSWYVQLINVYTNIEPEEAFRMYETMVPQLNELADAAAVLGGFQGSGNVRRGEFLLAQGNSFGVYVDFSPLRPLSNKDFDRTMKLIDRFSRREARILMRLQLADYEAN